MGKGYVYILTNDRRTVLYTGCTNDLRKRVRHHKLRLVPGFTKKYNVHQLVYYEEFPNLDLARLRERAIKGKSHAYKEKLISSLNQLWRDLFYDASFSDSHTKL